MLWSAKEVHEPHGIACNFWVYVHFSKELVHSIQQILQRPLTPNNHKGVQLNEYVTSMGRSFYGKVLPLN